MRGRGPSEGLLRRIHHVEEAVLVSLALVHLGDGGRHRHHAVAVHQQKEGLVRVQLQAPPNDLDELAHVNVVWYQELGLVQDGQLFLSFIPLNDDRDLVRVLLSDQSDVFYSLFIRPSLFKGFLRRHIASKSAGSGSKTRGSDAVE